ncbi:MAG: hypothetical protein ACK5LX_09105 [Oscillospiraceae bacterium]
MKAKAKSSRLLLVALSLVLILSAFAGCTGSGTESSPAADSSAAATTSESAEAPSSDAAEDSAETPAGDANLTEPGTFPIVNERVSISLFVHPTPERKVETYAADKNLFTQWYQDYTNVELNFVMAPSANDITTTLSTLMASGETPDILLSNNFSPEQQMLYGEQEIIMDISQLVENNAPNIKNFWDTNPQIKNAVTFPGGKVYAVNSESIDPRDMVWNKMFVYKPWLDELGLEVPTTTDEFYETLLAFKNNDPNGNGQADEIPLIGNTSWVAWNPMVYLIDPFTYVQDFGTGSAPAAGPNLFIENGALYSAFQQEGYKEGLRYVAKLYAEGLIAPETFTMSDMGTYRTVASQEPNIVGFMPSHAAYTAAEVHADDFVMMGPLKGPDGTINATRINTITNGGVVFSADTEYPEVCIRIVDGLMTEEVCLRAYTGEEGFEWEMAKEGATTLDGKPAKYHNMNSGSTYDPEKIRPNVVWPIVINLRGESVANKWYTDLWDFDETSSRYDIDLNTWTEEQYLPYLPSEDKLLPVNLVIPTDTSAELSDLSALITETNNRWVMSFVLGQADIDGQWDAFQAELEAIGLPRFIEIYQSAYDAMQ